VDKVEVDKVPAEARYWVYIHKPDDGHGVDMLLRWGRVVRHG
jgi:chitodextrinase